MYQYGIIGVQKRLPVCPPVSFGPGGFFLQLGGEMEQKEYKTYRQLLSKLRARGMIINKGSQGSRVMRILEQENYYNVINGYKSLFLERESTELDDEQYKEGTTFDEVYALYCFDREVRNIYLKYLLKIENSLKTVISHEFSSKYGHDNYLTLSNFQSTAFTDMADLKHIAKKNNLELPKDMKRAQQISAEENVAAVTKLIGDIHQEIARQMNKHHQVVTHYMTQHGYIPLWVLVNVLTFGKITNFYLYMKKEDKIKVAKSFSVNAKELHKYMTMLGLARNKCAHDERFYDISFKQRLHTKGIKNFKLLGIPTQADGSYTSGTNDAYAIAIIFALLLSKTDLREFIFAMKNSFAKLEKQLHTISIDDVMAIMGYHKDWQNLSMLKK